MVRLRAGCNAGGRGERAIAVRQNGTNATNGSGTPGATSPAVELSRGPGRQGEPPAGGSRLIARIAAAGSLLAAIVLVVLVLFGGGSTYDLKANFLSAGGLVTGDD